MSKAERDSWQGKDAKPIMNDAEDQDENEEIANIFIGGTEMKIVGIQYYQGVINVGELTKMKREPQNPYDSNAIRVDNMNDIQVGKKNYQ